MDDLAEFRGAIREEMGANDGGTFFLNGDGILEDTDQMECAKCIERVKKEQKKSARVEAIWCPKELKGTSWAFKTDLPCATFDIIEDGKVYCRGIVFNASDLPRI